MTAHCTDTRNALSFDLEHWHTATLLRDSVSNPVDHIESSIDGVLRVLEEHGVSATFFVVGEVAAEYPDLVDRVASAGHELGTHGHTHTPLFDLDACEFRKELRRSVDAIEAATDARVSGFRAPNFSVTRETAWAYEVIREHGLEYDSSVFPLKTPMYGVSGAPKGPYFVDADAPFGEYGASDGLLEVPVAVHPRYGVPVAGGFYARLLPTRVMEWGVDALNSRGLPAVLYFHPWEFNPAVRTADPPTHARFISFFGMERTTSMLHRLLERFEFGPVAAVVDTC